MASFLYLQVQERGGQGKQSWKGPKLFVALVA